MPRKRFEITEKDRKELQWGYRQSEEATTRTRHQAVLLYSQSYRAEEICQITGCSPTSLMAWWRKYRQVGVEGLQDHRGGARRSKLTPEQIVELEDRLEIYTPRDLLGPNTYTSSGRHWTVEDLASAVEKWYGVTWLSRTSYYMLFAHYGYSYQRTEKVYKSRRLQDVLDFEAKAEKN